jgi:iron complex outermembrane receptor protein
LKSLAIAVAISNIPSPSVHAQNLSSEQDLTNAEERAIEQIIVTAEKRNESLQDLSQAVTALTAKDLDNK